MLARWIPVTICLLASHLLLTPASAAAPQAPPSAQTAPIHHVTLAELVQHLPDYSGNKQQAPYLDAVQSASATARDAEIPNLLTWARNDDPKLRGFALLTLYLLFIPSEQRPAAPGTASLPQQYVPAVAAHLRDPDPSVRKVTLAALQPTVYSGVGYDELVQLVLPILRDPDVLTEYPDPFFIESDERMMATMPPAQREAFKNRPHKIIKLPAEGAGLLALLMRAHTPAVDDAVVAFLDRPDQTASTIGECLHTLALSNASERINDEALQRTFELHGINGFLLQFVNNFRLTPAQLNTERDRLLALANDPATSAPLRREAKDVAACWDGDIRDNCRPSSTDMNEEQNMH